jgi:hypothetical protein
MEYLQVALGNSEAPTGSPFIARNTDRYNHSSRSQPPPFTTGGIFKRFQFRPLDVGTFWGEFTTTPMKPPEFKQIITNLSERFQMDFNGDIQN